MLVIFNLNSFLDQADTIGALSLYDLGEKNSTNALQKKEVT